MQRKSQPASAEPTSIVRYCTPSLLELIRSVIREAEMPSWFNSVPYNFGDARAGTLKADEWRSFATVYLPIALVKAWGLGSTHQSDFLAKSLQGALDHTMQLVCAVQLACYRTTSSERASAYRECIVAFLRDLPTQYPGRKARYVDNSHASVHIYDFLLLFGPVHSWWTFPFERLIGLLQSLPSNHKLSTSP